MSANATGTPTTHYSLPKFNTNADNPNGLGVNEMMDAIDTAIYDTTSAAGLVTSVFGRTGAIVAVANDYTDAQIQNSTTNKLTTTGDIVYASAANTLARLAVGTAGQRLIVSGGLPAWKTYAHNYSGTNPSAITNDGVNRMLGIGLTITPGATGEINAFFSFSQLSGSLTNQTMTLQMAYGTGAAPANGAAATGTGIGLTWSSYGTATNTTNGTIVVQLGGLSVGTTYWFDVQCTVTNGSGGASSSPQNVNFLLQEV